MNRVRLSQSCTQDEVSVIFRNSIGISMIFVELKRYGVSSDKLKHSYEWFSKGNKLKLVDGPQYGRVKVRNN